MRAEQAKGIEALAGRLRREHYFYALWRLLLAVLLIALAFGPLFGEPTVLRRTDLLQVCAVLYLAIVLVGLWLSRRNVEPHRVAVIVAVISDVAVAVLAQHAAPFTANGIAFLLLVSIGAGAVLLPPRIALLLAAVGAVALLLEPLLAGGEIEAERSVFEAILLGVAYVGLAALAYLLAERLRQSQALAERRGEEAASLAQLNELIIRRMRTGVVAVDGHERIVLANAVARRLLGRDGQVVTEQRLSDWSPELARLFRRWRGTGGEESPLTVSTRGGNVAVHFSAVNPESGLHAIFLEDQSQLARRAQELTLSSLGRLSAGIAHEIRNPLAAISHAAQLIAESSALSDGDRALLDIVLNQSQRMNGIVESVLQLARRGPAELKDLDLARFARELIAEYETLYDLAGDELRILAPEQADVMVRADPDHLRQVVWNLLENARRHGRRPGEPARITVSVREDETGCPVLEVRDRGPGIPPQIAARIFEPFFTTSEFGTGLGLYIASELCAASGAELTYVPVATGGSCFRIRFARRKSGPE